MSEEPIQRDERADQADETAGGDDAPADRPGLADLQAQVDENWQKYLRAVAELDNVRKRSAREIENARKFGSERLAAAVLPVRDSLEAALAAAADADPAQVDQGALVDGQRATLRLLDQALESAGVREIDPHGEPFDPTKHEAISVQPSQAVEPDTVLEVIQKGYEIHDRLMRPARVIVARTP
jgi:molecular chaperone GrpE